MSYCKYGEASVNQTTPWLPRWADCVGTPDLVLMRWWHRTAVGRMIAVCTCVIYCLLREMETNVTAGTVRVECLGQK